MFCSLFVTSSPPRLKSHIHKHFLLDSYHPIHNTQPLLISAPREPNQLCRIFPSRQTCNMLSRLTKLLSANTSTWKADQPLIKYLGEQISTFWNKPRVDPPRLAATNLPTGCNLKANCAIHVTNPIANANVIAKSQWKQQNCF